MSASTFSREYDFNAFISYSRRDITFAKKLNSLLSRYSIPSEAGSSQKRLKVFQDYQDLTGNELSGSIIEALHNSEYLIVVCSPNSQDSLWVEREIREFAAYHGKEKILLVWLAGSVGDGQTVPDSAPTVPAAILEIFNEPLASDFRILTGESFWQRRDRHNESKLQLLATLLDCPKALLARRQSRRTRRLVGLAFAGLIAVSTILWNLSNQANQNALRAQNALYQANLNHARMLEDRAAFALEKARKTDKSTKHYQEAWLYSLAALDQEISPEVSLPTSLSRVFSPEIQENIFRGIWRSPMGGMGIESLAFDGAGDRLFVGCSDSHIRIINLKTGFEKMIGGFRGGVRNIKINPSQSEFAINFHSNEIEFRGIDSAEYITAFRTSSSKTHFAIAYNHDGSLIASVDYGNRLNVWDRVAGQIIATHNVDFGRQFFSTESSGYIYAPILQFHPQRNYLAVGLSNGSTIIYDVNRHTILDSLESGSSKISCTAFSPNGANFAVGTAGGSVSIWDRYFQNPIQIKDAHSSEITTLAFTYNSELLVTAAANGEIKIWNPHQGTLNRALPGHSTIITSLAFSQDERLFASGAADGTLHIRELPSWNHIAGWESGHREGVYSATISPNGEIAASGSKDHTVRLWDLSTGKTTHVLSGHFAPVREVEFSPDGEILASCGSDRTIRLWHVATGDSIGVMLGHEHIVTSVEFSPDGQWLASSSMDSTIRIWEIASMQQFQKIDTHNGRVMAVDYSPDGKYLLSASGDRTLRLWEAGTGVPTLEFSNGFAHFSAIDFSPSGKYFVSGSWRRTMLLWDTITGDTIRSFVGHAGKINSIAFHPTKPIIASASDDSTVRVWNANTAETVFVIDEHGGEVNSVDFSRDGSLLVSAADDNTLRTWNISRLTDTLPYSTLPPGILKLAFDPSGSRLASCSWDSTVTIRDVKSRKIVLRFRRHKGKVNDFAFSPDGARIISGSEDGRVNYWESETGRLISSFKAKSRFNAPVSSVAAHPTENLVAVGFDNSSLSPRRNQILVYEPETIKIKHTFTGHSGGVKCITFSPDNKHLISGDGNGTIRIWDIINGDSINVLHSDRSVQDISFFKNGELFATLHFQNRLDFWNYSSLNTFLSIPGSTGASHRFSIDPITHHFATTYNVGSFRLWNTEKNELTALLEQHSLAEPSALAISPDGKLLVSGDVGGLIRWWDLETIKKLESAKTRRSIAKSLLNISLGYLPYRFEGMQLKSAPIKIALSFADEYPSPGSSKISALTRPWTSSELKTKALIKSVTRRIESETMMKLER